MASLTIRLATDPATGQKHLSVAYAGDGDALPMEHEEEHRRLVAAVIGGGRIEAGGAEGAGPITVEREGEGGAAPVAAKTAEGERAAVKQGA